VGIKTSSNSFLPGFSRAAKTITQGEAYARRAAVKLIGANGRASSDAATHEGPIIHRNVAVAA